MSTGDRVKLIILLLLLVTLGIISFSYAETKYNFKYEITEDRIVVSCVSSVNPIIRTVPRPKGGYYAVVVCEGSK